MLIVFLAILAAVISLATPLLTVHASASHATAASGAGGRLWVTGHFPDFTCDASEGGLCHYLQVAVSFVMNGSTLPILALDPSVSDYLAEAIIYPFTEGGLTVPTVNTVDPRTGFASLPLVDSSGKPLYSAIVVASDYTSFVDCDPNEGCFNYGGVGATPDSDAINARSADIATFFKAGGGILALAGGPTSNVYYNFLPTSVSATSVDPNNDGFTLTSLGQSLGLTNGDVNNCCFYSTNDFQIPSSSSPLQVVETDSAGNAETLIETPTLWGVDSVDPIQTFYDQVAHSTSYGVPDFLGRYIGLVSHTSIHTNMGSGEKNYAHDHGLAIIPIYADYKVSAKKGAGSKFAKNAIIAAQILGVNQGVAIFFDIEANASPTPAFIQAWYDQFNKDFSITYKRHVYTYQAGYYKAGYYGSSAKPGKYTTDFEDAYCAAVTAEPQIATNSFIWASNPSSRIIPTSKTSKVNAPPFGPYTPECLNQTVAWQYYYKPMNTPPNVDIDEALGNLPFWHP